MPASMTAGLLHRIIVIFRSLHAVNEALFAAALANLGDSINPI